MRCQCCAIIVALELGEDAIPPMHIVTLEGVEDNDSALCLLMITKSTVWLAKTTLLL